MTASPVRPDVRAFLKALAENPRPSFTVDNIAELRELAPMGFEIIDLPVGELAVTRGVAMPGPGGDIALRLFDARAHREPGPVVVFFHGGGFVIGNITTHSSLCAEIARHLDLPVVSVDYRLAPEHPWPAAPDDAEAAARWISDHGDAFDREFTSLVLCGDSAGATLTLVTAIALRNDPGPLPVLLQIPFYPATDPLGDYPSKEMFATGYGLDRHETEWYDEQYRSQPGHWRAAPLHADLAGLPATVMVTAGLDPLRDQGRAFAAKLVQSGVATVFSEATGMIHGFATFRQVIPSAQRDVRVALDAARSILTSTLADVGANSRE